MTTTHRHVLEALKEIYDVKFQAIETGDYKRNTIATNYAYRIMNDIKVGKHFCGTQESVSDLMDSFRSELLKCKN